MSKPTVPSGMRDFGAAELKKRYYIIQTIRRFFELYGYTPLETPTMENLSTLTGKYGDEGDKLLYRVLNSGDFLGKTTDQQRTDYKLLQGYIAEKGMRYDLTVPFARYVVMNQHLISLPFRRYQIQPVWRADRPQKGRYREFYQCDADVVGSNSLLNEVELTELYDRTFAELRLRVFIKINNRKILQGIAEYCGCPQQLTDLTVAIDKLDKIGRDGVTRELTERGFTDTQIDQIFDCFQPADATSLTSELPPPIADAALLVALRQRFDNAGIKVGLKGCDELYEVLQLFAQTSGSSPNTVQFDPTLARGLSYYTGTIWEVKANEGSLQSSIGGGGRYDDLTGIFGLKGISGVGISFGLDRIYDILSELERFEGLQNAAPSQLMFINFGGKSQQRAFALVSQLRQQGYPAQLYPDTAKMDKQMKYANAQQIPHVAFVGNDELQQQTVKLKNMQTGEQQSVPQGELLEAMKRFV